MKTTIHSIKAKKYLEKYQLAFLKCLNLTGYFPEIWNEGLNLTEWRYIWPQHYRGIYVNSNLAKVLCSIINLRLLDFLIGQSVLTKSQIGFLPNDRTSDHIYTLNSLIDTHVNQIKNKIYSCFVYFEKAFDSILAMRVSSSKRCWEEYICFYQIYVYKQ